MIKKLRIKFMAVTMTLLIILLSAFFAISNANVSYWDNIDTSNTLEWIAESGVFTNERIVNKKDDELIKEKNEIVVGIIIDNSGNVLSQQKIGGKKGREEFISLETVNGILSQSKDKYSYKGYVYSIKELVNGNKLLVVQNTKNKSYALWRFFYTLLLMLFLVCAFTLLTFFLSKFITEPAKKALEREKQFVSDASHELKTPISAISINAQALSMDNDNINVKNILSESNRMNNLIEKLLTLSRYEEAPLKEKKSCSFSDIVNEISLTYESIAFEKEIGYQYEIEDGITVRGDEDELKQLAVILIDNAIKNTEPLGLVTINLSKQNNHCVFEVKNTGKGIAEKDLPHIFERFYTLSNSRSDNSFGLGLPIAKSIAERHKGTITVNSVIDEETNFNVVF